MVIRDQKHLATLSTGQRGGSVVQDLVTKCEDLGLIPGSCRVESQNWLPQIVL